MNQLVYYITTHRLWKNNWNESLELLIYNINLCYIVVVFRYAFIQKLDELF